MRKQFKDTLRSDDNVDKLRQHHQKINACNETKLFNADYQAYFTY